MSRFSFLVLVLGFLGFTTSASAQMTGTKWHALSQEWRNYYILQKALSYPDGSSSGWGVECKAWVQNVVYAASGNSVWLPQNNTDPKSYGYLFMWLPSTNVERYWTNVPQPGDIIQMKWKTDSGSITPHTMIIVSCDRYGMNVIDSNWKSSTAYCIIYRHHITWEKFRAQALAYSIYQVK